jgi:ribosomal protein L12E/L44/L45/RPP1/RPP2
MVLTSLEGLSKLHKEELVASLAILLVGKEELTAEKLCAVAKASGNSMTDAMAALYVGVVNKAPKGIEAFAPPPGGTG